MKAVSKYESKDRVRVIIMTDDVPSPMPHTTDGIEDCPPGAKIMPMSVMFVSDGTKYLYYGDDIGWVPYEGSITIDNLNRLDDDALLYAIIFGPTGGGGGGGGGYPEPTGTKSLTYTENGTSTENIKDYAQASITVNVPEPTGKKEITANGDDIDIKDYEFVKVNVPSEDDPWVKRMIEREVETSGQTLTNTDVTKIDKQAFTYFSDTNTFKVSLPNATSITQNAFTDNKGVSEINLPKCEWNSSASSVFGGCKSLTKVTMKTIGNIPMYGFVGCTNLNSINGVDGMNITNVELQGFKGCHALNENNISFPDLVTIDSYGFEDTRFKDLVLPSFKSGKTTYSNEIFKNSTSLESIKLPSFDFSFPFKNYFTGCTSLKTIDVGSPGIAASSTFGTLMQKSTSSMDNLVNLDTIIIRENKYVLQLRSSFDTVIQENGPIIAGTTGYIYVPSVHLAGYKSATNWSAVASRFRALEDYTIDGTITGDLDPDKI